MMKRLHPNEAQKYIEKLNEIAKTIDAQNAF